MQGMFLCISFSRSCFNEQGNETGNSNESGKIRICCSILNCLLTMSL